MYAGQDPPRFLGRLPQPILMCEKKKPILMCENLCVTLGSMCEKLAEGRVTKSIIGKSL